MSAINGLGGNITTAFTQTTMGASPLGASQAAGVAGAEQSAMMQSHVSTIMKSFGGDALQQLLGAAIAVKLLDSLMGGDDKDDKDSAFAALAMLIAAGANQSSSLTMLHSFSTGSGAEMPDVAASGSQAAAAYQAPPAASGGAINIQA